MHRLFHFQYLTYKRSGIFQTHPQVYIDPYNLVHFDQTHQGSWRIDLYLWIGQPVTSSDAMGLLTEVQGQIDEKIKRIQTTWGNIKA